MYNFQVIYFPHSSQYLLQINHIIYLHFKLALSNLKYLIYTSLLDSLIYQRTDSRSKKNYNSAACGMKTHSQKDRQNEKAEDYVPDEGTR